MNATPANIKPRTPSTSVISTRLPGSFKCASNMSVQVRDHRRLRRTSLDLLQFLVNLLSHGCAGRPAPCAALNHHDNGVARFLEGSVRGKPRLLVFLAIDQHFSRTGFSCGAKIRNVGSASGAF